MKKLSQKIEVTANILIISVSLILIGVIARQYFFAKSSIDPQVRIHPIIGKRVDLPDENFSAQTKTLIFALQTTCHFCNESAPFYKHLIENVRDKNVKLVAVFPTDVSESTTHLNELGLTGFEVRQAPISVLDASGTPTLILTNDRGEITNYWVGKLTPEKETEVIDKASS